MLKPNKLNRNNSFGDQMSKPEDEHSPEEIYRQTRIEDNPGATQNLVGDDNQSIPSDISIDLDH